MPVTIEKNINAKAFFPESQYIIEYAFSLGDRHYFRFHDAFNIPAERALSTITFYRELELNCDRAYLKAHSEAVINCLTPTLERPSIEAGEALQLERLLLSRMNMPKDSDLMYKLASVVFFDQYESPILYEYDYGRQKIARWKNETTLKDFFLQQPIIALMPYLENAGENLAAFSQMVKELNKAHSARMQAHLSSEQWTTLKASSVLLQGGNLQN